MLRWLIVACLAWIPLAWSQEKPPVTDLGRDADLVAIATLERVLDPPQDSPNITVQLRVLRPLKGVSSSSTVFASIAARPPRAPGRTWVPPELVGNMGIWFLRSGPAGYEILSLDRRTYQGRDLFLPLVEPEGSPPPA